MGRIPAAGDLSVSLQRPFHSARVGDTGEIHYAWHPLVGQRVPILYTEHRRGERVAICEMPDGSRAVVPVWMLDRVACATLSSDLHGARSLPFAIFGLSLTAWGFMVVLPRTDATGRRRTMTTRTTDAGNPRKQLPLYLPAAGAPPLEGVTRDAVVQLLAHLLTSACTQDASREGRDETR